jgi:hypothetical protein
MKILNTLYSALFFLMILIVSSCSSINEIYTSGMGLGIFTALAIIVVIAFVWMKARKK